MRATIDSVPVFRMHTYHLFDFQCHWLTGISLFISRSILLPVLILLPNGAFAVTEDEVVDFLNADPSFLSRHPELLEQAFRYEQLSREKNARVERAKVLSEAQGIIEKFQPEQEPSDNRKKTVIAFMDYDCRPCRQDRHEHQQRATQLAEKVEIIQIPLGIMSSASAQAVRLLLALQAEDRRRATSFHQDLLNVRLPLTYATVTATAAKNGIQDQEMEKMLRNQRASDELKHIQDLAVALGVEGTPAYLAGCELVKGRAGLNMLIESWVDCIPEPLAP